MTSREALGLDGEWVLRLTPFETPAPDAPIDVLAASPPVQLMRARTEAAGAAPPSPADLPLLAHVCRQVDGLPLAIELAAVVFAEYGLHAGSDGLVDRLLAGPGGFGRRPSLEATVEWSLDRLDDATREVFTCCGVFPSWFAANDAAAITGIREVEPLLASLVTASLLTVGPGRNERRYRLLAPLREIARHRLGEATEVGDLHAHHIASQIAHLTTPTRRTDNEQAPQHDPFADIAVALDWLEAHPDPSVHLQLTADLWVYWYQSGRVSEGHRRTDAALATSGGSAAARSESLSASALFAWVQGDYATVRLRVGEVLALGPTTTRLPVADLAHATLAWIDHELDDAEEHLGHAIERVREAGNGAEQIMVGTMWATVAWFRGRPSLAAERFRETSLLALRFGNDNAARMTLRQEALMLALSANPAARATIAMILQQDERSPDPLASCQTHTFAGLALLELGDIDAARPLLRQGFREAAKLVDAISLLLGATGLVRVARSERDATTAALLLGWLGTMLSLSGLPLPEAESNTIETATPWARSHLGDETFETQLVRGSALSPLRLAEIVVP